MVVLVHVSSCRPVAGLQGEGVGLGWGNEEYEMSVCGRFKWMCLRVSKMGVHLQRSLWSTLCGSGNGLHVP